MQPEMINEVELILPSAGIVGGVLNDEDSTELSGAGLTF
jgi:hypothetical protein